MNPKNGKIKHPATYTDSFIPVFNRILQDFGSKRVLDPLAGTGKLALVKKYGFDGEIYCNELEREWINHNYPVDHWTFLDAAHLEVYPDCFFDAIVTSPVYGNRLSDTYAPEGGSFRVSYTYNLGHRLHPDNTGGMQWAQNYRAKHLDIYREFYRLIRPGGLLVVNISNHIRKGKEQNVVGWTKWVLNLSGFRLEYFKEVSTPRLRRGANFKARVPHEVILVMTKPMVD